MLFAGLPTNNVWYLGAPSDDRRRYVRSVRWSHRDINALMGLHACHRIHKNNSCMFINLRSLHRPVALVVATSRFSSRHPAVRVMGRQNETEEQKAARKQAKKASKEARRLQRQGLGSPDLGQKPCTLCGRQRDLLIR